jgi:FkbM family methyltransferase
MGQSESVEELHVGGVSLRVLAKDASPWREAAHGTWEPETVRLIQEIAREGELVIDIGAWRGVITAVAAGLGAAVHAFEPDPVAREALERMLELNPEIAARVTVHPEALGGSDRTAKLAGDERGGSGSSLFRDKPNAIEVRVRDAAAALGECEVSRCALLKIDVEGAEYEILPRILPQLREHRPVLLLAVHTYQIREPYAHLPLLLRGLLYRVRALPRQAKLIAMTRRLGATFVADPNSGRWRPLRGRTLLAALASVKEKELLVDDESQRASAHVSTQ